MASMSDYYPERWDWKPNVRPVKLGLSFRLAGETDIPQLRQFLKKHGNRTASVKALLRWIKCSGWTAWLAVRNGWNIVGFMATKHIGGMNEVLCYGVAPTVADCVLTKLLVFAAYEMPENPTEIVVKDDDLETQTLMRKAGVACVKKHETESHVFRHPPIVTIKSGRATATGEKDRKKDSDVPAGS